MTKLEEFGPTVPVPIAVLDSLMPRLKDTELRLLLVVVRQTIGWVDPLGGRKNWDWLTHSQLRRRTGRSSSALSRAIHRLASRGIILVSDHRYQLKLSQNERRRSERLLFSLGPVFHNTVNSPFAKVQRTKESLDKR